MISADAPAASRLDGRDSPVETPSLSRAWVVVLVVLAASVAAACNWFKVPALLPVLMDAFRLDLSAAGWLVSVFSITGVVLALPSGLLVHRLGARGTGIVALALVAGGSLVGSLGLGFWALVVTRIVEGTGFGLISVAAPALIAEWFPPERRGAPMGLYAIWAPAGAVVAFNVLPGLIAANDWETAWLGCAAIALVGLAAYVIVARSPAVPVREAPADEVPWVRALLASRDIWYLSGAFACTAFVMGVVPNFYATYLVAERGWTLEAADGMAGLRMAAFLVSCPVAGLMADRIGSWKLVYTVPTLATVVAWPFLFTVGDWHMPALLIATGLLGGAFPTAAFAAVPEVMRSPRLVGMGMAILTLGLAASNVVGPVLFGYLVGWVGWVGASLILVPATLVGVVLGWKVKVR